MCNLVTEAQSFVERDEIEEFQRGSIRHVLILSDRANILKLRSSNSRRGTFNIPLIETYLET